MVGGIILVGVLLAIVAYYWSRRAKSKENTAKITARMTGTLDDVVSFYYMNNIPKACRTADKDGFH